MYRGFLTSNSILKRKTPLRAKKGFIKRKSPLDVYSGLKRSGFAKKKELTEQQECDRLFSLIIRRSAADSHGMVKCFTCPEVKHWSQMQNGHFRPRGHMATRYHPGNVAPQCERCNCFYGGETDEFANQFTKIYGPDHVEFITNLSNTIVHDFPYKEKIMEFTTKLAAIVALQENEIQY